MKKPGLAFALFFRAFSVSDPEEEELSEALGTQVTDIEGGRLCSFAQGISLSDDWRPHVDARQRTRAAGELLTLTTENKCP
jgi:hypothetical protein